MSKKELSHKQFLKRVRARCEQAGSIRKYAENLGLSPSYVSMVARGAKSPSPKILEDLGMTMRRKMTVEFKFQENV